MTLWATTAHQFPSLQKTYSGWSLGRIALTDPATLFGLGAWMYEEPARIGRKKNRAFLDDMKALTALIDARMDLHRIEHQLVETHFGIENRSGQLVVGERFWLTGDPEQLYAYGRAGLHLVPYPANFSGAKKYHHDLRVRHTPQNDRAHHLGNFMACLRERYGLPRRHEISEEITAAFFGEEANVR